MDHYWWWAIGGIALIIAELITGTFYLLVIGIAALAGAVLVAGILTALWSARRAAGHSAVVAVKEDW